MAYIALYRGTSFISKLIRFFNWSEYSHASFLVDNGMEYESWPSGKPSGVQYVPFGKNHTKGTKVDLFSIPGISKIDEIQIENFLKSKLGQKYDWFGVVHFITRKEDDNQNRWFCSELIEAAFESINKPLLSRIPAHKVYPAMLAYSPLVKFEKQIVL